MNLARQAYRFALDPNDHQRGRLASHAGGARYAYNLGLQWLKASLDGRTDENDTLLGAFEMHRRWNLWKKDPANGITWWKSNSKCVYQEAFIDLGHATKAFFASSHGRRRGAPAGFPRYKRKGKSRDHFRLTGLIRVGNSWVQLPKLGKLRLSEDPTKLLRQIAAGKARVTSASVNREAQRWYVSLRVECKRKPVTFRSTDAAVGLDLGINNLVTLSNGVVFAPARALRPNLRRLRRLSKAHSRKKRHSANRLKSSARLARCHARIVHLRRDYLHKLTTHLAKKHGRIVVEGLTVRGMIRNHRLARSIADASWGEFSSMIEYKCRWYGAQLIRADRHFASSRTCSNCGHLKQILALSERTFTCDVCAVALDRDLNAAKNLAHWPSVADSASETVNACREGVRPGPSRATLDEAGTEQPTLASGSEPIAQAVAVSLGQMAEDEGRVARGI
jgi:putative transposase